MSEDKGEFTNGEAHSGWHVVRREGYWQRNRLNPVLVFFAQARYNAGDECFEKTRLRHRQYERHAEPCRIHAPWASSRTHQSFLPLAFAPTLASLRRRRRTFHCTLRSTSTRSPLTPPSRVEVGPLAPLQPSLRIRWWGYTRHYALRDALQPNLLLLLLRLWFRGCRDGCKRYRGRRLRGRCSL